MSNMRKLGVLKAYINFQLTDYIAAAYSSGDKAAIELINSFSQQKSFEPDLTLECLSCKETTLAIMAGMIFFVRSSTLPPLKEDKYQWSEYVSITNTKSVKPSGSDIRGFSITLIRNAIAHWDEGGSGVEFLEGATRFSSNQGTLELKDTGLHFLTMQMYGYAQRA